MRMVSFPPSGKPKNREDCLNLPKFNRGMARLGRQVDHFREVDINSIAAVFSPDKAFRYALTMNYHRHLLLPRGEKEMTVILKNPSSADEKRSDSTIRKVETFVWKRFPEAATLHILNIFSFRATDALELSQRMKTMGYEAVVGEANDHWFEKLLTRSDGVICAWGGPSGIELTNYELRIKNVKKLIDEHFSGPVYQVVGKQTTKEPLHGLMWGYDYAIKDFSL